MRDGENIQGRSKNLKQNLKRNIFKKSRLAETQEDSEVNPLAEGNAKGLLGTRL